MRLLLILFALLPLPATAAPFVVCHYGKPKAACVYDGDTLWFRGTKIRTLGFDAPEMGPPNCPGPAALAEASRDGLLGLLNSGAVTVQFSGEASYDRRLGAVLVDGVDVAGPMRRRPRAALHAGRAAVVLILAVGPAGALAVAGAEQTNRHHPHHSQSGFFHG